MTGDLEHKRAFYQPPSPSKPIPPKRPTTSYPNVNPTHRGLTASSPSHLASSEIQTENNSNRNNNSPARRKSRTLDALLLDNDDAQKRKVLISHVTANHL